MKPYSVFSSNFSECEWISPIFSLYAASPSSATSKTFSLSPRLSCVQTLERRTEEITRRAPVVASCAAAAAAASSSALAGLAASPPASTSAAAAARSSPTRAISLFTARLISGTPAAAARIAATAATHAEIQAIVPSLPWMLLSRLGIPFFMINIVTMKKVTKT